MDGELARAKGMAGGWSRIVDGIGDDVSGMAILIGLMIGIPESRGELMVLTALIFLRGITFDYFKEYMMGRVTYGYDGPGPDLIFFHRPVFLFCRFGTFDPLALRVHARADAGNVYFSSSNN